MKKVAILQSNYIPWKGYFDLIAAVDEFVLYDDVQFTRRDWRNRNLIKTPTGRQWLTVPVRVKGRYAQSIRDSELDGNAWRAVHWTSLERNYRRAPFYPEVADLLRPWILEGQSTHLSDLNKGLIQSICNYLGIKTTVRMSSEFDLKADKSERLASICEQCGAKEYVSGPAAKDYLEDLHFLSRGISVSWFDYSNYPMYPQLWGEFSHQVSVVDLLFNCGQQSARFMRNVKN
jgi:hypothetical protein